MSDYVIQKKIKHEGCNGLGYTEYYSEDNPEVKEKIDCGCNNGYLYQEVDLVDVLKEFGWVQDLATSRTSETFECSLCNWDQPHTHYPAKELCGKCGHEEYMHEGACFQAISPTDAPSWKQCDCLGFMPAVSKVAYKIGDGSTSVSYSVDRSNLDITRTILFSKLRSEAERLHIISPKATDHDAYIFLRDILNEHAKSKEFDTYVQGHQIPSNKV